MIVGAGDAIVDLFAMPLGADVAEAEHFVPRSGGAPANMVTTAARLGVPARFLGAVGEDAHGRRLLRGFEEAGVDTRYVARLPGRTGVTFVRVEPGGKRSFLFYRQGGAESAFGPETLAELGGDPLEGARWLHLCSSALGAEPFATVIRGLRREARARGVALVVDLNVRPHLWRDRAALEPAVRELLDGATIVKASEEDLEALGREPTLDGLCAMLSPATLGVLTLAERGCVARLGAFEWSALAPEVPLRDATGAGDAFTAALTAALELRCVRAGVPAGLPPATDARWGAWLTHACEVGAAAVTEVGATGGLVELGCVREKLVALASAGHSG